MSSLVRRCTRTLFLLLFLLNIGRGQLFRIDTLARAPIAQYPVAIAFVPGGEGRFFFTEKRSGRIRLFTHGVEPEPFASLQVEDEGEQGMLGITVDPHYPDEPYVYVFCTRLLDRSSIVVRFRDSLSTGVSPKIIQIIPREDDGMTDIGGAIHFGPDGKLYISVGDYGTNPSDAQDITSRRNYRGKILRVNSDGTPASDNPVSETAFWSYGHRNPTGFTFDAKTGMLYCVEGGTAVRNEVFAVPPGANLGWPESTDEHVVTPLYTFPPGAQPALTSILVYREKGFPRLRGKILFGGYAQPTIWVGTLSPGGDSLRVEPFFRSNAGYADIEVAPDGGIVFSNGPYISSRILKISPVAPAFLSSSPSVVTEGVEYLYTPAFAGTPPSLSLVEGPPGMTIDSSTWSVRWEPKWSSADAGRVLVALRADNGAGSVEQRFTLQVINVNDPPLPFVLVAPPEEDSETFLGTDPEIVFRWQPSTDPDQDTVRYHVQLDTTEAFQGRLIVDTLVSEDSLRLQLPRRSATYYWKVTASDGTALTPALLSPRRLQVEYSAPTLSRADREHLREPVLEQNFPNPFNPSTSIKYTLERAGYVRLAVYNLLGQEVALLVNSVQQEGVHEVEFLKADLPSGIYFYRLQAPGLFETKKMMITK
jgi:glucose/arabinose dehydrogenase